MKHRKILILVIIYLIAIPVLATNLNSIESLQLQPVEKSKSRPSPKPSPSPSPRPTGRTGSNSFLSSLMGFIVGPILFLSAFSCIYYNERRAAIEYRRIKLAEQICEEVDVYSYASAMSMNNKLVHASGETLTTAYLNDPICGVGANELIKIERKVEMLEWRRKTKKENDQEVEYYELEWVSHNSSVEGERYNDPTNWILENETFYNEMVFLGGFRINQEIADLCSRTIPYHPSGDIAFNLIQRFQRNDRDIRSSGEYIYITPVQSHEYVPPAFDNIQAVKTFNTQDPPMGTLRAKFNLCPIGLISIVGKAVVQGESGTIESFNIAEYEGTAEEGKQMLMDCTCCCACTCYKYILAPLEQMLLVKESHASQTELFDDRMAQSRMQTTFLRIGAYVVMVIGICLFFSPVTTLLGYIPLVGGFVSGVAGFAIFLGAVLACIPLFLIAVSLAWLRFHPKVGLMVLGVGLVLFFLFWKTSGPPDQSEVS